MRPINRIRNKIASASVARVLLRSGQGPMRPINRYRNKIAAASVARVLLRGRLTLLYEGCH
jgi:hypothetical protein